MVVITHNLEILNFNELKYLTQEILTLNCLTMGKPPKNVNKLSLMLLHKPLLLALAIDEVSLELRFL